MKTQKAKSTGRDAPPPEEFVDRLAGLLLAEELERALQGPGPSR